MHNSIHRLTLLAGLTGLALTLPARAEKSYEAWRTTYDQNLQGGQSGNATVTDSRGNVIVAGFTGAAGSAKIFYTAKYAATDGSLVWEQKYDSGQGDCVANAVAVDSQDNVIVTGSAAGGFFTGLDYYTVKYSADGVLLWNRTYAGPAGGADEARKVVVDHQDNVIVTGTSVGSGSQEDWFTIKYAGSNGKSLWGGNAGGVRVNGGGNQKDVPAALAVDSANHVLTAGYLTASTGKTTYYTLKQDGATGSTLWGITANPGAAGDCEATALAVDKTDRVLVTGIARAANNTRSGYSLVYTSAGAFSWSAFLDCGPDNYYGGPVDAGFDSTGAMYVLGTARNGDIYGTTFFKTVKYAGPGVFPPGAVLWSQVSPSPDRTDYAAKLAVDGAGNAIVTGASSDTKNHAADYYTAKYDAQDGHLLSEYRYDGAESGDSPKSIALDNYGNAVVTGTTSLYYGNTNIRYNRICTIKYNRLRVSLGDDAPGAGVAGSGIPAGMKIGAVYTPALADNGAMTVRVILVKGAVRLNAILLQSAGGANRLLAVQGQPAAGLSAGKYAGFLDPVIAPDGRVAYFASMTGVPVAQAAGVWITDNAGQPGIKMQTGTQLAGLTPGLLLRSVASLSWRSSSLIALTQVYGTGVTVKNATMLYGYHTVFGGSQILRTDDQIDIVNTPSSKIASISAFNPAPFSNGQGRSFGSTLVTAKVTLADRREVLLKVSVFGGSPTPIFYTNQLTGLLGGYLAKWRTLSYPALGSNNYGFVTAATLQPQPAGMGPAITAANAQALVYSADATGFDLLARQGDPAPGGNGAKYALFLDPVVNNQGDVAFCGLLSGAGVTAANRVALWWGAGNAPSALEIVARSGTLAPNGSGETGAAGYYSSFSTVALPGGAHSGPIFMARLAGPGVNIYNNSAVFALDSSGLVRRLLRTGDSVGARKVTAIALLLPTHGSLSVTRSYNETGSIEALVSFTDHTTAVMHLAIP